MRRHVAGVLRGTWSRPEAYHAPTLAQCEDPRFWFTEAAFLEEEEEEGYGVEKRVTARIWRD